MRPVAYAIAAFVISLTVGVSAQAGGGHGRPTFEQLDKNGDGKIVESEVPPHVWQRLRQADTNKDNAVTKAEFEAARASKGGHGGPRHAPLVFEELDKNRDGKIVESKVSPEVWRWLRHADTNKDNAVTKAEFEAARASGHGQGGPGKGRPTFEQLDKNGDGKIVPSEVSPEVWQRLSRADTNKDNAVTKAEFEAMRNSQRGNPPPGKR